MATSSIDIDSDDTECYIFIDHSNLWIAGKNLAGQLVDSDSDPRYRVNLGSFVEKVRKNRSVTKAHLYGSRPPPNDAVWKAAENLNFEVSIFDRSASGKEKEVDVAMATHITRTAIKFDKEAGRHAVFIVVTGDRDLKTPIEDALGESPLISVELWSWEQSLARDYRLLANNAERFIVGKLDDIRTSFSYKQYRSSRKSNDIDPGRTAIYKNVSNSKTFYYKLADELCLLSRLFYISKIHMPHNHPGEIDLVVEFPNTDIEHIFKLLKTLNIDVQPISYPEYKGPDISQLPIKVVSTFEAMGDCDADAFTEVLCIEPESSQEETKKEENSPMWEQVVRRKPGVKTRVMRRKTTPCKWGDHCGQAGKCGYLHTDEEKKIFENNKSVIFKYWKTRFCEMLDKHTDPEKQKMCGFAHNSKDSWCLKCKAYGHLKENCKG